MSAALLVVSYVIAVLAVYRAARMLSLEDGPFDLFVGVRERISQKNWVGRGVRCPLCVGFWVSILPAAYLASSVGWFFLLWFGISGGAVAVHKYLDGA